MTEAIAILKNFRQSPRKMRVVADLVRGKKVDFALASLKFINKKASAPLLKLIQSAVANAKQKEMNQSLLFVKEITVNGGRVLVRRMPAARGRASPIKKRTSHVSIILEEKVPVKNK